MELKVVISTNHFVIYLEMLQNIIHLLIIEIVKNDPVAFDDMDNLFQQDGVSSHFYRSVRNHLVQQYTEGWIGGKSSID